ncbi:MAG: PaaI family thioesterase [bacterium]|nr:PaaI family thioesterase [bacterium]
MRSKPGISRAFFCPSLTQPHNLLIKGLMKEIVKYSRCFVCGDENSHGLKAKFLFDGKQATTCITADDAYEGYHGIYHGGIIATLLDEVMIKAILAGDIYAVTAEMTVRYHRPVAVGDKLNFAGRVTRCKGKIYFTEGEVTGDDGAKYASATGKYIEAKPELAARLAESLD